MKIYGQLSKQSRTNPMLQCSALLRARRPFTADEVFHAVIQYIPCLCWRSKANTFIVASLNGLIDDLKKSFLFLKTHPLLGTASAPPSTRSTPDSLPTDTLSRVLNFLQHDHVADITGFLTNPRFNDPAYLTTLSIVLAAVFIAMSWFSRSGGSGWGGRFSPFGRPGTSPNAGQVSDADFSYITSEDLKKNRPEIVDWEDKDPTRETDVLVFKNGKTNYPTHFPAQSIRNGELRIGTVRQAAAKKIGVDDPRRIRMFYKGKNLKHDERSAREEGLRGDGSGSEILCAVGEAAVASMAPGAVDNTQRAWSDGEDEGYDTESGADSATNAAAKKRPRKRGGKKNKKKGAGAPTSSSSTPGYSHANAAGAEFLPIPSHIPGPRPTSAPPANAPRAATPQTPMAKLDAIASKFHTEFVPLCVAFMTNPPQEKSKSDFEYKKLSETILTQILMKLDGVESEGDQDARMKRKEIVKEVNAMLNRLDDMGK